MTEVQVLHLLAKHEGSRNPVSRRTGQSTANVSKAEAHGVLKEYEAKLRQKQGAEMEQDFRQAAFDRSDCGSFKQGGDLGMFGRGAMQKPFEDESFRLQVGEMSRTVDTDSGSHLILRIA